MSQINYNQESIKTMPFGEAVRKKLGMYLCADKEEALLLGLRELIYNAQDEYEQGFGNKIEIDIDTNSNIIVCKDNARGIPCGQREDGTNSLIAAFTLPHSGAKHDTEVYSGAVGINGIGAKVVCHTSEFMDVVVFRDNHKYTVSFKETDVGAIVSREIAAEKHNSKETGTIIKYKPSQEIYGEARINIEKLKETIRELSYFAKGMTFILNIDNKEKYKYISKNGLTDALNMKKRLHPNALSFFGESDGVKVELALQWSNENPKIKAFANNLYVPEGGAFMTGFKTSLTKAFKNITNKDFSGDFIRKYLDGYISIKVKIPQFTNQSKTSLANAEARTAVSKITTEAVKRFFEKNPKDLDVILKIVESEQKAENAAQRAREAVNKIASGGKSLNALKDLPIKLADCNNRNGELFIVEGNSAGGNAKSCRDANTQAILSLRGKVLNTCTKDLADMLKNKEIKDIITSLGCGISNKFNINNLRYNKIIIMADADPDGKHISLLLFTLFLYHLPELILAGKIYQAVTPLYAIHKGKDIKYFFDDLELDNYLKTNVRPKNIIRFKGLGELNSEQLWDTTMNPERRKLLQLTTQDIEKSLELFDQLMGKSAKLRREFILENTGEDDE